MHPRRATAPLHVLATGLVAFALTASCVVPTTEGSYSATAAGTPAGDVYVPDLPIAAPPYDAVPVSWKQRMDQPYVYMEHKGSYAETGSMIPVVQREALAQGLVPSGAPFCLFFDDPSDTPVPMLRSRACVPIGGVQSPLTPLRYDVLPSTTVSYAYVSGPYPHVPRAYPALIGFMERNRWVVSGPIRETYLVPPTAGTDPADLVCEIQIPSGPASAR